MGKSKYAHKAVGRLSHHIHRIQPLLQHEEFTLAETVDGDDPARNRELRGIMHTLEKTGAIKKLDREYRGTHNSTTPSLAWKYRWEEGVREDFRQYIRDMDTLPCGCREHIPDSRDDPDGVVSCKHCGHEYDEGQFRELVL
jgi:hypothetical protein